VEDAPADPPAPVVSRAARAAATVLVDAFAAEQPFPLDPFQREAAQHLAEGRSVLVAAPTGTGKTVVAECGIWLARRQGLRAIYTAPLKALSNQKFRDLRAYYGPALVGLMTGDIVENPTAPIVVMTTEIYRNMLLEGSRAARRATEPAPAAAGEGELDVFAVTARDFARQAALDDELSGVGCVIFDELHYLSDPERGPVWEEAIIHSPAHVTFVGLSATVSNADQLCRWITEVHGPTGLVFHVERAVPLEHWFYLDGALHLVQSAEGLRVERFPNIGGEAKAARERNRPRVYVAGDAPRGPGSTTPGNGQPGSAGQAAEEAPVRREAPEPGEILTALRQVGLLPCLYFLPGRRAVEVAAESAAGHLLTSPEQRAQLHAEVQAWVRALPTEDQRLDQVRRLANLLPRGLAFHHAGLLPGLKVMVETLFARGDLRAVFATDTLALGINMPARSVVLGSLSKFDGTSMRLLTPNEYQQLTGRAGRRGMDAKGAAVIPYSPWDAFEPAFALLTGPLQPVISAFTLRYNTVLNLWTAGDQRRLRAAVAASLREFQRHGSVRRPPAARRQRGARAAEREPGAWLSRHAQRELDATIALLRRMGYIAPDDVLTVRGRLLRALFHPAGMPLVELCVTGALESLGPAELAEVVSWFTFDDDRSLRNQHVPSHRLREVRRAVYQALKTVQNAEYQEGLALSPGVSDDFYGVALNWWRGISLGGLLRQVDLAEGDLLVSLNQTIDLLQQVQGAVGQVVDSRDLWAAGGRSEALRQRLANLRPALDAAWRGLLRGSVAQSRAIPAMASPDLTATPATPASVALPMAEDADPAEARQDRIE
jgi:superfamily II RNA helicase